MVVVSSGIQQNQGWSQGIELEEREEATVPVSVPLILRLHFPNDSGSRRRRNNVGQPLRLFISSINLPVAFSLPFPWRFLPTTAWPFNFLMTFMSVSFIPVFISF
jgi:hypothetical protein